MLREQWRRTKRGISLGVFGVGVVGLLQGSNEHSPQTTTSKTLGVGASETCTQNSFGGPEFNCTDGIRLEKEGGTIFTLHPLKGREKEVLAGTKFTIGNGTYDLYIDKKTKPSTITITRIS